MTDARFAFALSALLQTMHMQQLHSRIAALTVVREPAFSKYDTQQDAIQTK